jgi:hypothetical protein
VCAHPTDEEARTCACTGYGMGDLLCRCGRKRSRHTDGTGACTDPAARCHEFVLTLPEETPVSELAVQTAALALKTAWDGQGVLSAEELARVVLFSGAATAMTRDWELAALRRSRDAYREQVAWMTAQLDRLGVGLEAP